MNQQTNEPKHAKREQQLMQELLRRLIRRLFGDNQNMPEHFKDKYFNKVDVAEGFAKSGDFLIAGSFFHCPICKSEGSNPAILGSNYLESIFKDLKTRWLANMITHMRHEHVRYYNNGVEYMANYREEYDEFKNLVNERQKRQLIRKVTSFLIRHKITSLTFAMLQNTTKETINLASKKLKVYENPINTYGFKKIWGEY